MPSQIFRGKLSIVVIASILVGVSNFALAENAVGVSAGSPTNEDQILMESDVGLEPTEFPRWNETLKTKYLLTQTEIDAMAAKKISPPQMAMISEMALKSGKTREEVLALRVDQKMGWGQVAKSLGVPPGEIGKSVSALRKEIRSDRREDRQDRAAKRDDRMDKRESKRDERMERREAKRAAREARKK